MSELVPLVMAMVSRRCRRLSEEDREDIQQECLLKLWRGLPTFDASRAKLSTWAYQVIVNAIIDHTKPKVRKLPQPGQLDHEPVCRGADPAAAVANRDAIIRAGADLSPRHRQVLDLLAIDPDISAKGLGAALGITGQAAGKLRRRVFQNCQKVRD